MRRGARILLLVASVLYRLCSARENDGECLASLHHQEFYINGTWARPVETTSTTNTTTMEVIDPSTGTPIATIALAGPRDVDTAVAAARDALRSWSLETTPEERRVYVEKLLEIYRERQDEMGHLISMEMGAPIDMAIDSQAGSGVYHTETFLAAMDHFAFERFVPGDDEDDPSTLILMDPVGVVALITPWNWVMNQVTLKVIPALLVGCTCVLKPSEIAPLSSLLFAEMMHDAGFPPGVFNLLNGDGAGAGADLSKHKDVDMVSFTGSTRAGALITKAAADTFKRVSLELGGKGANLIFADVTDVDDTITDAVYSCFGNSGQSCNAPCRMLVERSLYDTAVEVAEKVAKQVEVKSAHEHGDHLGPVVSDAQFDKIQRYIETGIKEGARLVAGGLGRPEGTNREGYFVRPTVFADCNNSMTIMREEISGPVLCIAPFDTEEEALFIANDTPYGLTNYVQSQDAARRWRLARRLRSGMVEMNWMEGAYGAPFGGVKASGNAREGGVWGLEEFCEVKAITGWQQDEHPFETGESE